MNDLSSWNAYIPVVLMLLTSPTAFSNSSLEAPIFTVTVQDEFGPGCHPKIAGICPIKVEGESLGNATVDTYQRIYYIGIATNFTGAREHVGDYWLLPDHSVFIRGSDLYVPNPVFPAFIEAWSQMPRPHERYWVKVNEQETSLHYEAPVFDRKNLTIGEPRRHQWELNYSDSEYFAYDRIGPFNTPRGNSVDNNTRAGRSMSCHFYPSNWPYVRTLPLPNCAEPADTATDIYTRNTPNVWFGLEFYDIEIATDPSNLTSTDSPTEAGTSVISQAARAVEPFNATHFWEATKPADHLWQNKADPPNGPRGTNGLRNPPLRVDTHSPPPHPWPENDLMKVVLVAAVAGAAIVAVLATLYSRFTNKADILRSKTRARLLEIIHSSPGITISEASRTLGMARNATLYQLRMLEKAGEIKIVEAKRGKYLYAKAVETPAWPAWALRNRVTATILAALHNNPRGLPRKDIHSLLPDTSTRMRNYYLHHLIGAGLVTQVKVQGEHIMRLSPHHCEP